MRQRVDDELDLGLVCPGTDGGRLVRDPPWLRVTRYITKAVEAVS